MLLAMVDVDDFDGARKLLGGDVPNPWSAVADDDLTVRRIEAAPLRLAIDYRAVAADEHAVTEQTAPAPASKR